MSAPADMMVFVRALELGGFSAAARELGLTPSAVSKLVTRRLRAFPQLLRLLPSRGRLSEDIQRIGEAFTIS